MEEVIKVLSEIEEKANRIITNAQDYKKTLDQESKLKQEELSQSISRKLEEQLSLLKKQCNEDIAKDTAKINAESDKQLMAIEQNYNANLDIMVDKLFRSIIEV